MSELTVIEASARDRAGKGAARATRKEGLVPGVIYGDGKDPMLVKIDPRNLSAQYRRAGFFSTQFNIKLEDGEHRVLPRDIQFHPVTDQPIHVDFLRVGDKTRVTLSIQVQFTGEEESPGIKRGGVLNVVRHEVEVVTAAGLIPETLTADISELDVGDAVRLSSLNLPEGVRPVIKDRDFMIASVAPPTVVRDEALEAAAEAEGEEGEEGTEEEGAEGSDKEAGAEDKD